MTLAHISTQIKFIRMDIMTVFSTIANIELYHNFNFKKRIRI